MEKHTLSDPRSGDEDRSQEKRQNRGETSRRSFLHGALASTSLLAVGQAAPVRLPQVPIQNPALTGGRIGLGLVTYNLAKDWDLPTLIANCEKTGFEAVELRTTHRHGVEPTLTQDERKAVRLQFEGRSVRLLSLGSVAEFHSPEPREVRRHVEDCKQFLQLAHDIGALGVKVRPNGIPASVPEEQTLAQIGKALRECGETAQALGVEVWVEVHGKDSSHPRRMRRMMEEANHPHVGICWNSNPEDLIDGKVRPGFELLQPWLRNVHINELWKPEYPWREVFGLMKAAGYNRYMLAEVPESQDPIRFMHYYKALWTEYLRP
jgi:sugar phosphate isomerase/epimerase